MLAHRLSFDAPPQPARFADRRRAGGRLAEKLTHYRRCQDAVVLALPRGGVPVAFEVARALDLPLDVFVLQKLDLPGYDDVTMGAIASGGVRILDEALIERHQVCALAILSQAARAGAELANKEHAYRGYLPPLVLEDRIVVLADDGVTSPSSLEIAIAALRQLGARRIVACTPIAASDTVEVMRREADEMVSVLSPEPFVSVGRWYADHTQTTDDEVRELLRAAQTGRE